MSMTQNVWYWLERVSSDDENYDVQVLEPLDLIGKSNWIRHDKKSIKWVKLSNNHNMVKWNVTAQWMKRQISGWKRSKLFRKISKNDRKFREIAGRRKCRNCFFCFTCVWWRQAFLSTWLWVWCPQRWRWSRTRQMPRRAHRRTVACLPRTIKESQII